MHCRLISKEEDINITSNFRCYFRGHFNSWSPLWQLRLLFIVIKCNVSLKNICEDEGKKPLRKGSTVNYFGISNLIDRFNTSCAGWVKRLFKWLFWCAVGAVNYNTAALRVCGQFAWNIPGTRLGLLLVFWCRWARKVN